MSRRTRRHNQRVMRRNHHWRKSMYKPPVGFSRRFRKWVHFKLFQKENR